MKILLILAGNPPDLELLESEMTASDLVVAVDGGSNVLSEYKLDPDLIIGDLDSINFTPGKQIDVIKISDQNLTDLQKAFQYLEQQFNPSHINILGGMGGRVDHTVSNLHISALVNPQISITFMNSIETSETFRREIVHRIVAPYDNDLPVTKGSTVSVFTVSRFSELRSKGLSWDLDNVSSKDVFGSQSNISEVNDPRFSLKSGCVYIAVYQ